MKEELAALRLGYLAQELRYRQRTVWSGILYQVKDVDACLHEIHQSLCLLSSRMNDFQRAEVVALRDRVAARHDGACRHLVQIWIELFAQVGEDPKEANRQLPGRVSSDEATEGWNNWQEEDWREVQNLLQAVVGIEGQCGPWFAFGNNLGDVVFQLLENRLSVPLLPQHWDYLYAGVDKLPPRIQRRLNVFFPQGYNGAHHLALQLASTFQGLCNLLAGEEYGLDAVPRFDGVNLTFRNRQVTMRVLSKKTSVMVPILNELERLGWPESGTSLPPGLKGDVKQAIYNFNKEYDIVRLTFVGGKVRWGR